MKSKIASIKKTFAVSGILLLLIAMDSCKKDEIFTTGTVKEFSLQATSNGATYAIRVGLPANYNPSGEKYATIYVLDGKEIFGYVSNRCQEISDQYALKNVLVVSIGYGRDRSIDYTPTKMSSVTGGAPQFLNFIETQLIPKMEHDFQADTNRESRVILGHSYGGLFGEYAFCVRNRVFSNYIMLSPSLWFNNYIPLQMEKENRANNKNEKQLVFLGIGEKEESDRMLAPFNSLYESLQSFYTNISLAKNIENNTSHMSSRSPNIVKGLIYYFLNR